jgi:N4-gp56 family major capsid protein
LTNNDKLTLATVNKLRTKAVRMLGGKGKPVKMTKVTMGGKECFVLATCPEGIQDIRDDVGAQGWMEAQKALVTSVGKDAELFKGGAGMFNGVLIDEMEFGVYFNDYGSGSNVLATRSLFMGANAISVAHGTKGMADGMTVSLDEDMDDRKHDHILFFEMIMGADKNQFEGLDYGMISVDHAYTPAV